MMLIKVELISISAHHIASTWFFHTIESHSIKKILLTGIGTSRDSFFVHFHLVLLSFQFFFFPPISFQRDMTKDSHRHRWYMNTYSLVHRNLLTW
jgi:hypothetical protein